MPTSHAAGETRVDASSSAPEELCPRSDSLRNIAETRPLFRGVGAGALSACALGALRSTPGGERRTWDDCTHEASAMRDIEGLDIRPYPIAGAIIGRAIHSDGVALAATPVQYTSSCSLSESLPESGVCRRPNLAGRSTTPSSAGKSPSETDKRRRGGSGSSVLLKNPELRRRAAALGIAMAGPVATTSIAMAAEVGVAGHSGGDGNAENEEIEEEAHDENASSLWANDPECACSEDRLSASASRTPSGTMVADERLRNIRACGMAGS